MDEQRGAVGEKRTFSETGLEPVANVPYKRRSFADKVNMQIQAAEQEKQARESGSRSTRVSSDQEVVVA